jgi:hypothetical protein
MAGPKKASKKATASKQPAVPLKAGLVYYKAIAVLLACLLYANSLNGELAFDDEGAVTKNKDVTDHNRPLSALFQNDFWGTPMTDRNSHKSFRPLTTASYRLNHYVHGLEPMGYHVVNILMHAIVTALFMDFCQLFLVSQESVFVSGLLFASHPIHTEAVAGIVGRCELLSAFFFVTGFLAYHKACQPHEQPVNGSMIAWTLCSCLLCAVGMLCKEPCLMLLGLNGAYDAWCILQLWIKGKQAPPLTGIAVRFAIVFVAGISLLASRVAAFGTLQPGNFPENSNPHGFAKDGLTRMLSISYLWAVNVWLLLWPQGLCADWSSGSIRVIKSLADVRNMATLTLFAAVIALAYFVLLSKESPRSKTCVFVGVGMLVVPFVPAMNIFFIVATVIGERILYIPSMGYILLLGSVFDKFGQGRTRPLAQAVVALLLVGFSAKTWSRNKDWESEQALFQAGVETIPTNGSFFCFPPFPPRLIPIPLQSSCGRFWQSRPRSLNKSCQRTTRRSSC